MPEIHGRSKFFMYASIALLVIVLIGFSPTFYLRTFFDVPAIPTYVYGHGAALTAWFIWFCVQTTAVHKGRVALHRRLGVVGITIGVLVLVSGAAAAIGLAPRLLDKFGNIDADMSRIAAIVWGNIGMLVAFTGFLVAAVLNRHRPEFHKRLMYLASIGILLPAFGRIAGFPMIDLPQPPLAFAGLLTFLVLLGIFDKTSNGSVHRVTLVGGIALLANLIFFGLVLPTTAVGRAFVLTLT
ncbi:MAG: hypothetical protein IIA07_05985 [Proteobacteria bacterium]|nr:hypothetical protein [Pseudomonadota bacterium]